MQMRQWWLVPGPDGGRSELRDVPVPEPAPTDLLVKVAGAGVNRGELIGRAGHRSDNPKARPVPSGIECAGEVIEVGAAVTAWAVGDRVMARASGCYADFAIIPEDAAMTTPSHLDSLEAAAIPNVFVTAHDAIVSASRLQSGEAALISAGPSGVGTAAIQIAAHLGASQIHATTRSPDKADALVALGATSVVDTSDSDWASRLRSEHGRVDVVIDQVGGELFPSLLTTMAIGGRYVSVGRNAGAHSNLDLDLLARNRLQLIGVTFRTRTPAEALACSHRFAGDLLDAFEPDSAGQIGLRPVLDRTFALDELPEAHAYMAADGQLGKIVLVP